MNEYHRKNKGAYIEVVNKSRFYGLTLNDRFNMKTIQIKLFLFYKTICNWQRPNKKIVWYWSIVYQMEKSVMYVQSGLVAYKGENIICSIIHDITAQRNTEIVLRDHNADISEMLNVEKNDHRNAENKLEELMDTLEISNKAFEQFAYVSSHDLREPLRMITSFLQLLKRRYSDDLDEDANDFINYAVEGAKRLDMMINDLLEFSEIGTKERELKYLRSDKIVEQVLTNIETLIKDTNADVTYDSLPIIYANEYQMIQLFQNLIENGIKFHGKNRPKIHISAKKGDNEYIFAVKDNGIGIEKQHLERIFTIFQRLHPRREYDGSGIGLAISQRIIKSTEGKFGPYLLLEKDQHSTSAYQPEKI